MLAVNRPAAEDQAAVLNDDRVAGLFQGLDFSRVDSSAGSSRSLVEEIWRLFMQVMIVAMIIEASLCLPKLGRRARGRQGRSGRVNDTLNYTRTLAFLWTPWSVVASMLLVSVAAGLSFAAWRRSGYRGSIGLLELLRMVLVIVAALLLNQPEIVQEYRPEEKPTIAVLWDASPSMETRDADPAGPAAKGGPVSAPPGHRRPHRTFVLEAARRAV